MSERRRCFIGDLCDEGVVELQTGPFGSQLHAHDYVSKGVPVIPTEAIRARQINHSVLPQISRSKANELKRHHLQVGDILFARRGVQATGHIGYIREAERGFICGTGAIRLRVKVPSIICSDYLSHVFADSGSIEWFKFHSIGATMPNLNEGIIRSFPLDIPSLEEQISISALLSAIDDKIDLNRRMNETLEAMARAVFKDWFVDFGPVRAKAEGRPPYLAPELCSLFPDALDDEDKPAEWQEMPLSHFVNLIGGGTPKTSVSAYWGGEIPWFSVADAPEPSNVFAIKTEKSITEMGLECSAAVILPIGSTIITARGTVGKLAVVGTKMTINQSCYAAEPKSFIGKYFGYFLIKKAIDELKANSHGSVFDTITRTTFDTVSSTAPCGDLPLKFDETIKYLMERIKVNLHESEALTQLRDLLLPKLMSGEIRLKDAEKAVEAAL